MISYAVMTLADTLFVGRLGSAALAGVGLGGVVCFTLLCFPFGLMRGAKVLISQAVGAADTDAVPRHARAALGVAIALGFLVAGLAWCGADLLRWVAATPESGAAAANYAAIRCSAGPFVLAYVAMRESRYGIGDSRSPMVSAVLGNIANVALDALFIVGFDWGVEGAALATCIAHVLEAGLLAGIVRRTAPETLGISFRRDDLRALWDMGMPTGVQFFLEVGSFTVLAGLLASMAELEMAAHQIALQVMHFTFLPNVAVSEGASVLAGQAVGARRFERVPRVARESLAIALGYAVFCTFVLVFFGSHIARGFTDEPDLIRAVEQLLWVGAVFQLADAANVIARGVLRGTGDVRYAAVLGIATAWLCTPPLTWLLGYELGLGALGGWLGLCAEIMVGAALLWLRLRSGAWRNTAPRVLVPATA